MGRPGSRGLHVPRKQVSRLPTPLKGKTTLQRKQRRGRFRKIHPFYVRPGVDCWWPARGAESGSCPTWARSPGGLSNDSPAPLQSLPAQAPSEPTLVPAHSAAATGWTPRRQAGGHQREVGARGPERGVAASRESLLSRPLCQFSEGPGFNEHAVWTWSASQIFYPRLLLSW